jgi:hypothetical protein
MFRLYRTEPKLALKSRCSRHDVCNRCCPQWLRAGHVDQVCTRNTIRCRVEAGMTCG